MENLNSEEKIKTLENELKRAKAELWLLYEIGNAMRTTLNLPEVLYVILSAVTSREGLGFNRAMLFLVNKEYTMLEGRMAVGPIDANEAHKIWKSIEEERLSLDKIIEMFHRIESHVVKAPLNNMIKEIKVPLHLNNNILAMCVLEGMNVEVTTDEIRDKISDPLIQKLGMGYFACVPLKGKHHVQGALLVDNLITQKPITKDDIRVLTMFAGQAGLAIENAHLYEETKYMAHTDSLTRLWNHGHFQNALADVIQNSRATGTSVSLAIIDMDNFKSYNDILGHQKGDVALREVAAVLKRSMRNEDLVCRYGGEEFAIIMPNMSKPEALNVMERLRSTIEKTFTREKKDIEVPPLTISIGISSCPNDTQDKDQLIEKADKALYSAKKTGKNKTVIFS